MAVEEATKATSRRPRLGAARQEVVVAAVFLVATVFFRLRLDSFVAGRRGRTFIDPDFWPGALLTFGIVLSALYLVTAVLGVLRPAKAEPRERDEAGQAVVDEETAALTHPWSLAIGFGLLFGYVFVLRPLGFVPSTLVFCVAFLLFLGERRWYVVAAFPVVIVAALLGVFTRLLVVPLPRGNGAFLQFSTYLY